MEPQPSSFSLRTISLRQLREKITELTEPTAVVRRNDDGSIEHLGVWVPNQRLGDGSVHINWAAPIEDDR